MFYLLLPLVLAKVELVTDEELLHPLKEVATVPVHIHPDMSFILAVFLCTLAPILLVFFELRVSSKQKSLLGLQNSV